jgi:plastocyanin
MYVMGTSTKNAPTPETRAYPSRRELRYRERKNRTRNRWIGILCAIVLVVVVGAIIVAVSSGGSDTATTTAPFNGTTVNVVLGDYVIQGNLTAPAGNVRLQAINQGGIVHNVGIKGGPISGDMQPGKGFTLDVGSLAPGTYQLYCDIPGHEAKGMVANLVNT